MTTKNLDRRHPLVKMVEHSYLTLKGRKKNKLYEKSAQTEVVSTSS